MRKEKYIITASLSEIANVNLSKKAENQRRRVYDKRSNTSKLFVFPVVAL